MSRPRNVIAPVPGVRTPRGRFLDAQEYGTTMRVPMDLSGTMQQVLGSVLERLRTSPNVDLRIIIEDNE